MIGAQDVHFAADQLDQRAVIRTSAVDTWVALALEQPDPAGWTDALVAAALSKLTMHPENLAVKSQARLELLDIQLAIHSAIAPRRGDRPKLIA